MRDILIGFFALIILFGTLSLVGCDEQKFEKEHPAAAEAIEITEEVLEPIVDAELHLPQGTAKALIDGVEKAAGTVKPN